MKAQGLGQIPVGAEVLIDANVLVYGTVRSSAQSVDFLRRCATGEINGFATVDVLADACHKLMIIEAAQKGLIMKSNASSLQGKPQVVQALSEYYLQLMRGLKGIAVLPLDEMRFHRAQLVRQQFGLMTNDSLLVAAADLFGIDHLASNDSDFESIPWLQVYKPTDVP